MSVHQLKGHLSRLSLLSFSVVKSLSLSVCLLPFSRTSLHLVHCPGKNTRPLVAQNLCTLEQLRGLTLVLEQSFFTVSYSCLWGQWQRSLSLLRLMSAVRFFIWELLKGQTTLLRKLWWLAQTPAMWTMNTDGEHYFSHSWVPGTKKKKSQENWGIYSFQGMEWEEKKERMNSLFNKPKLEIV